jgi:hypothetical protein
MVFVQIDPVRTQSLLGGRLFSSVELNFSVENRHLSCALTKCRGVPRNAARRETMGKDGKNSVRMTATLTKDILAELERLADLEGVSVSWLLRKGAEILIERANDGPLLPGLVRGSHGAK